MNITCRCFVVSFLCLAFACNVFAEDRIPDKAGIERLTAIGKEIGAMTDEEKLKLEETAPPAPTEFAYVLSHAYGGADNYPRTVAEYEDLLINMQKDGYNTLYGVYREWRAPLLRKYGIKLMIDILAWYNDAQHDVRDPRMWQRPRVKEICERVRNDRAVWGYNIWNEPIHEYFRGGGDMNAHVCLLKKWDGTHPIWVGTKYSQSVGWVRGKPGVVAWYDYHWARGFGYHYGHCTAFSRINEERDSYMGRWMYVHDYNRNMYTLNQSIAHGLKVGIWFIGRAYDIKTQQWHSEHHFCRIGREMHTLWPELGKFGRPVAHWEDGKLKTVEVFSTPDIDAASGKAKVDPKTGKPIIIGGWQAFPEDHWAQVGSGSVVAGFFKYADGSDAIYVANHQALEPNPTTVVIDLSNRRKQGDKRFVVGLFDRASGKWRELPVDKNTVSFELKPAGGELLSVGPVLRRSRKTFEELGEPANTADWATDALQVAWDLEGPELEKAVALYGAVAERFKGKDDAHTATARLTLLQPRLKAEQDAWTGYEGMLAASGELQAPPGGDDTAAVETWRKQNAALIEKLQKAAEELYATHPDTMGATRARGLLEKFRIAENLHNRMWFD